MRMQIEQVTEHEERQWMSAIAAGDQHTFQQLYRRYSPIVYSLALRITGQDHDAEDVVADVFWELWDKSARYCPSKGSPCTYIIVLTRCRALDKRRGLARHASHPILDWATDAGCSDDSGVVSPVSSCSIAEQGSVLRQAVGELDVNQRRVIECAFFDGLSHRAISEKLGLPIGTVKGRIRAALEHLRTTLHELRND